MNVKDEKNAKIKIVRFETSTSPSWKDKKIFISHYFLLNINIIAAFFLLRIINSEEYKLQIQFCK